MQSSKEDNSEIDWSSEKRKRHAEAQKKYRDKIKRHFCCKRSDMSSEDLDHVRALDRKHQKKRKDNLTKEEMDSFRAKDRERKAKERKAKKEKEMKEKTDKKKKITTLEKKKFKQRKNNIRIQSKIRDKRSEEEKEKRNAEQAEKMRMKREEMSDQSKRLALIKAKEGMRVASKLGYLKKYKQRKIRDMIDPFRYGDAGVNRKGFSIRTTYLCRRRKQKNKRKDREVEELKKIERLKEMNRTRVKKHRLKMKRLLEEPVIIKECSNKGDYELLREANIREFERLKQESGLFD